jgi:hypothetical protein
VRLQQARAGFAILVVVTHVVFVFAAAVVLAGRVTKPETYISTITVFLPVFGVYVGIVANNLQMDVRVSAKQIDSSFVVICGVLFAAYFLANALVIYAYLMQFIGTEDLLPAAFAATETAFGAFFTTMFQRMFGPSKPS